MNPVTTNCILFVTITYVLTCIIAWSLPPLCTILLATLIPATIAILLTVYNKQSVKDLFKLSSLKNCSLGLMIALVATVIYILLFVLTVKFTQVTEPALTPEEMSDFNVNTPSFLLENFIILIITSLGKEIGWRGYLLTNLKDQIPNFYVRAIAVGLIVAIWHMPIFQVTGPLSWNDGLTFSIACTFTLFYCVESIVYTWLFEKDNSIWPVTIAHVTMHFMIQMTAMSFTTMSLSASTVITPMNDAISLTIAYLIVAIGIILFENTQGRSLSV